MNFERLRNKKVLLGLSKCAEVTQLKDKLLFLCTFCVFSVFGE